MICVILAQDQKRHKDRASDHRKRFKHLKERGSQRGARRPAAAPNQRMQHPENKGRWSIPCQLRIIADYPQNLQERSQPTLALPFANLQSAVPEARLCRSR